LEEHDPFRSRREALRIYLFRVIEVSLLLALLILISWVFVKTLSYTLPFVLGIVLAIFLNPLVKLLERFRLGRTSAVLVSMIGSLGILISILSYGAVQLVQETTSLIVSLPAYFENIGQFVNTQIAQGQVFVGKMPPSVTSQIEHKTTDLVNGTGSIATNMVNEILQWVIGLPDGITILVMALIATFFFLINKEKFIRFLQSLLPPTWDVKVSSVYGDVSVAFAGLIRAQGILVIVSMILGTVGLVLLKMKYAITLGLLIGISGLIPLVGSLVITVPWAAGALLTGNLVIAIKILILQGIISAVRHVIEPKILADSVGLDTLSTLISMYIGLKAIGILGLFLGPIFLIGIKSLLRARMFIDWVSTKDPILRFKK
jgi:sporulation integral membrane protein YtvI